LYVQGEIVNEKKGAELQHGGDNLREKKGHSAVRPDFFCGEGTPKENQRGENIRNAEKGKNMLMGGRSSDLDEGGVGTGKMKVCRCEGYEGHRKRGLIEKEEKRSPQEQAHLSSDMRGKRKGLDDSPIKKRGLPHFRTRKEIGGYQ